MPMPPTLLLPLLDSTFQRLTQPVAPLVHNEASALPPADCRCHANSNTATAGNAFAFLSTMVTVVPLPATPFTVPMSKVRLSVRAVASTFPTAAMLHARHALADVPPQVAGDETAAV